MAPKPTKPDFEEHIANLPHSADRLAIDVVALAESGEELQAESILRLALGKHGASNLRVALAHVLIRQDRFKEAMTEMVSVLRADQENSDALLVLATCLMECGELDRGGKMLQKARLAGADEQEAMRLEERWRELVAKSTNPGFADLTLPDISGQGGVLTSGPGGETDHTVEEQRKRHETLMGRPTTDRLEDPPGFEFDDPSAAAGSDGSNKPRRLPPPPLQSGTFASLDTWDIDEPNENDLDTTAIASEKVRLSDEGPLERIPASESHDEYAAPDDMTAALVLEDEDLASPDDPTAHIPYDEVERGLRDQAEQRDSTVERNIEEMPSVEYDAGFAEEARGHAPPADLDDLPNWDSDIEGIPGAADDHWDDFAQNEQQPNLGEQAVAQSRLDYGDWDEIPSFAGQQQQPRQPAGGHQSGPSPHGGHPPAGQNAFQSSPGPDFAAAPAAPRQQYDSVPPQAQMSAPDPRHHTPGNGARPTPSPPPGYEAPQPRREETAIAASPAPTPAATGSLRFLVEKRWPLVLVIFLAVVMAGFLAVTIGSGWSLASDLSSGMQAATNARATDTFQGYETAERELIDVTQTHSFMGSGFDRFVETTLPLPGLSGANLRERAVAELAAVSATLEYRFEKIGTRSAAERLAQAKEKAGSRPATAIADAYIALAANAPGRAVELLEVARSEHPDEGRLIETLGWAQLAMDRTQDAAKTVEPLRDEPEPTVQQRFLFASVDAARGADSAADAFAEVFADSPDHADARIERALALLDGDESAREDAQKALDAVLTKLEESSSSFQKARATSAYGSLYLASGKNKEAEERFRSAVAKMPTRGELYAPLVKFLARSEKRDEVDALLKKARSNNAMIPGLVFFEAERRLMESKPERTLQLLEELEYESGRKAFLRGFALIDQYKPQAAETALEKGRNAPGDATAAEALFFVARSLASEEAVEDATYQLERIKSKNADNAIVHWASAVVSTTAAEVTTSKKTRDEQLEAALTDIERAFELDSDWAPIHFTRCDILQRQLEFEDAEKFCNSGTEIAPAYAPGLVTLTRLRLMEGKFDDADKLIDRALELRPNDAIVGLTAARVAIERREIERARKILNKWLGKSVDQYEISLLEGRLEFAQENYTRAAGYLKEAFELRPNAGEASIYYGHTLARLGDFKNAGELLKKYLSHPTWAGYAWAVLGEVRRKQRRLRDTFENLDKAIKLYSKQPVPDRYWSHVYTEYALANRIKYRKWRHPRVKRMLNRGRSKGDPNDPGLNMAFGQYYLNLRRPDYDKAMEHIQKVVDVAPYRCDAVEALKSLYDRAEVDEEKMVALDEIRAERCAPPEEEKK